MPTPSEPTVPAEAPVDASDGFLGRAAGLLAASVDFAQTLRQTVHAALPALGDFGFFDVVDVADRATVRRTAGAPGDPALEALLNQTRWVRQAHPGLNLCALSSGDAALHADLDDAFYRRIAGDEAHLALLRRLAFRSMITVPVKHRGELVGALTLFMGASGRQHDARHLRLAQDLASMVAPAVVNVRLVELYEQSQAALASSEERLRLAAEARELGIWDWDIEHGRVTWSEGVYRLHGLKPGDYDGTVEAFAALVHPDDRDEVWRRIRASLDDGEPYAVEFRTLWPDGSLHWLVARATVRRDAAGRPVRMVGATLDVTGRVALFEAERRARREAEQARQRLELLAATSARLSQSLEPRETLAAIASTLVPAIADWCRIDLLQPDGRLSREVCHHADAQRRATCERLVQELRGHEDTVGSMAWCVRTGQSHRRNVESPEEFADTGDADLLAFARGIGMRAYCVAPLVARGRMLGALAMLQAESGRHFDAEDAGLLDLLARRAALALDNARLYAEAESARREAEQASRAKDEFLAMLSHELRNPLAPIVTTLKLMAMRDDEAFRDERRLIERQVGHLSRLVDDLLDVARIVRGDVQLRRGPVPIDEVLGRAVETAAPLIERRRHTLRIEVPAEPLVCDGDAQRLVQVFANLVGNAARYTPDGGTIEIVAAAAGDGQIRVRVRDDGAGISAEVLPRVFELFYRGRTGGDGAGGLGIGLALVKNLVELHGGRVDAHSDGPGRGSEFVVTLPAAAAGAAPQADAAPAPGAAARSSTVARPRRVLLVDDNIDARETLAVLLGMSGHRVRQAGDPARALEMAQHETADVAVLDIGLPGMDGHTLAARLRALPGFAHCRFVALSGYGAAGDRARSSAAGFDEHLVKPVDPQRLLEVIER